MAAKRRALNAVCLVVVFMRRDYIMSGMVYNPADS